MMVCSVLKKYLACEAHARHELVFIHWGKIPAKCFGEGGSIENRRPDFVDNW